MNQRFAIEWRTKSMAAPAYYYYNVDDKGRVKGSFIATGIRPAMMQRIKERGIELDESIFDPDRVYE